MDIHVVVCSYGAAVLPLVGGLMEFAQVCLCLYDVYLEFRPGLSVVQLRSPGASVLLELTPF